MTKRTTYYPFKAEVPITQCKSLDDVKNLQTRIGHLLELVNEIVEWKEHEYSIRVAGGRIIFWFKQERYAIITILRCS